MAIKRIVGLEGFSDSGKSSVLRAFCKRVLGIAGCEVLQIRHGTRIVHQRTIEELISEEVDFTAVIRVAGMVIVIVLAGDKPSTAENVIEVFGQFELDIDILFVAMRSSEDESDNVGLAYRRIASENGLEVKSIFKPGFKRTQRIRMELLRWSESIWVDMLMKELPVLS